MNSEMPHKHSLVWHKVTTVRYPIENALTLNIRYPICMYAYNKQLVFKPVIKLNLFIRASQNLSVTHTWKILFCNIKDQAIYF